MIKSHALDTKAAKPVERAAKYLIRNSDYLHYDRALAEGLPIATGVIEGACRYLVQDRMGRTSRGRSLTLRPLEARAEPAMTRAQRESSQGME